jgi:hypothetical protein
VSDELGNPGADEAVRCEAHRLIVVRAVEDVREMAHAEEDGEIEEL